MLMDHTSIPQLEIRADYPDASPSVARAALRDASKKLTERGLAGAAKWALELLVCIPKVDFEDIRSPDAWNTPAQRSISYPIQSTPALRPDASTSRFETMQIPPSPLPASVQRPHDPSTSSASAHVRFVAPSDNSTASVHMDQSSSHQAPSTFDDSFLEREDDDVYQLAKSLFDHHQWDRCVFILEKNRLRSPRCLFLKLYAQFLILERKAEEDYFQGTKREKGKKVPRSDLVALLRDLIDPQDPFLLFLKGILFRKLYKRVEAIDCFIRSLELFPYNWSAWQELSTVLEGGQAELQDIGIMLPDSFMTSFFCELFARSSAGRILSNDSLERIDSLLTMFPNAPYLLICKGQVLHMMQDLEASEEAYEAARAIDPLRLDGMADYSNSLFVQGKEEKLAHLTHSLAEAGREDAEVCCAVGNYHTLRGDNHRAVEVFKRGVRLDPSCSSAWILLGHGFIELKDSIAAAEMYRKALELNPRDVRAWTGLGNTFELNSAWAQALHYHKKAAANSPYDYRFWASMANCYEKLLQPMSAIECYRRILTLEHGIDQQLEVMVNIAQAYETLADAENTMDLPRDDTMDDTQAERMQNMMRACTWHKRIAELIDHTPFDDSAEQAMRVKEHVTSFLVAARWEIELLEKDMENRSNDRSGLDDPHAALANDYLNRVVMTGTEAVIQAEELLKKLALLQT